LLRRRRASALAAASSFCKSRPCDVHPLDDHPAIKVLVNHFQIVRLDQCQCGGGYAGQNPAQRISWIGSRSGHGRGYRTARVMEDRFAPIDDDNGAAGVPETAGGNPPERDIVEGGMSVGTEDK